MTAGLYLDGCPACTARDNAPLSLLAVGPRVAASYCCRSCRTPWTTSWFDGSDPAPLLTDSGATGRTTP